MNISRQELVQALQVAMYTGLQIRQNEVRQAFYLAKRDGADCDPLLRAWAEMARGHSTQVLRRAALASARSELARKRAEAVVKANGNGFHWGVAS